MAVWGCLQLDILMPVQMTGSKWVPAHCEYVNLTKNLFFDDFFTNFRQYCTLLSMFSSKNVFSNQWCASIWDHQSIRLEISSIWDPWTTIWSRIIGFKAFLIFNSGPSEGSKIRMVQVLIDGHNLLGFDSAQCQIQKWQYYWLLILPKKVQLCY